MPESCPCFRAMYAHAEAAVGAALASRPVPACQGGGRREPHRLHRPCCGVGLLRGAPGLAPPRRRARAAARAAAPPRAAAAAGVARADGSGQPRGAAGSSPLHAAAALGGGRPHCRRQHAWEPRQSVASAAALTPLHPLPHPPLVLVAGCAAAATRLPVCAITGSGGVTPDVFDGVARCGVDLGIQTLPLGAGRRGGRPLLLLLLLLRLHPLAWEQKQSCQSYCCMCSTACMLHTPADRTRMETPNAGAPHQETMHATASSIGPVWRYVCSMTQRGDPCYGQLTCRRLRRVAGARQRSRDAAQVVARRAAAKGAGKVHPGVALAAKADLDARHGCGLRLHAVVGVGRQLASADWARVVLREESAPSVESSKVQRRVQPLEVARSP